MKIQAHGMNEPPGHRRLRACASWGLWGIPWRLPWVLLLACALFLPPAALAWEKPFLIGALTLAAGAAPPFIGLRDGLVELGYEENTDFVIGVRFAAGNQAALLPAARKLVSDGAHLIFTQGEWGTQAASKATRHVPIVFTLVQSPVKSGYVKSFAKPGGNMTGVTNLYSELAPKRLELFRAMVPNMKAAAYIFDAESPEGRKSAVQYRAAAKSLGLKLVEKGVGSEKAARAAFSGLRRGRVDGIIVPGTVAYNIVPLAQEVSHRERIPTMFGWAFSLTNGGPAPATGGFSSYGPSLHESGRLAARMVDKIMRGVKPADIPVEVNTKLEFVINLRTAKKLGLKVPPEVLFRADRIIR